ncbi:MAG TPA: alanine racemase, partial [Dehalococcoidia bacterium]|nr:alanine racemase [Dehalococcoidia bacterium]
IAQRADRAVPVLLEVNVAGEASKFGFRIAETGVPEGSEDLREAYRQIRDLPHLDVRGLMTVAPLAAAPEAVRPVFRTLAALRKELALPLLSMGMTDDYPVAIEEGATHIRLGRAIFGARP